METNIEVQDQLEIYINQFVNPFDIPEHLRETYLMKFFNNPWDSLSPWNNPDLSIRDINLSLIGLFTYWHEMTDQQIKQYIQSYDENVGIMTKFVLPRGVVFSLLSLLFQFKQEEGQDNIIVNQVLQNILFEDNNPPSPSYFEEESIKKAYLEFLKEEEDRNKSMTDKDKLSLQYFNSTSLSI